MKEAKWNKEFDVGIIGIDKTHRKLLAEAKAVFALLETETEPDTDVLKAMLDNLRDDMLRHLDEEEAFMQYMGYENLERHKRQHDIARKKLAEMEAELVKANYSSEMILRVLGRAIGFMTAHVPEDMAIKGKGYQRTIPVMSDVVTKMEMVISDVVRGIFHMQAELMEEHFDGKGLKDATYHELHYLSAEDNRLVRYMVVIEKQMIESSAGTLISKKFENLNLVALCAMREITRMIFHEIGTYFRDEISRFRLVHEAILTEEEAMSRFGEETPYYGMLFDTKKGRFAICFNIDG
ncbi:MAG: hemerythrin domain-containing protein [Firmicutes bacterium]|nr:hemerythrin domain-containing protein [Bacillota bacterium]